MLESTLWLDLWKRTLPTGQSGRKTWVSERQPTAECVLTSTPSTAPVWSAVSPFYWFYQSNVFVTALYVTAAVGHTLIGCCSSSLALLLLLLCTPPSSASETCRCWSQSSMVRGRSVWRPLGKGQKGRWRAGQQQQQHKGSNSTSSRQQCKIT
jgi:hypothetical protein